MMSMIDRCGLVVWLFLLFFGVGVVMIQNFSFHNLQVLFSVLFAHCNGKRSKSGVN